MHSETWERDGQTSTDLIVTHIDFELRKQQRSLQRADDIARRCVSSLCEDQSVLLARLRVMLSWPTPIPRRTGGPGLGDNRYDWRARESASLGGPPPAVRRHGEIEWPLTTFYRGLPKLTRQARLRRVY